MELLLLSSQDIDAASSPQVPGRQGLQFQFSIRGKVSVQVCGWMM